MLLDSFYVKLLFEDFEFFFLEVGQLVLVGLLYPLFHFLFSGFDVYALFAFVFFSKGEVVISDHGFPVLW